VIAVLWLLKYLATLTALRLLLPNSYKFSSNLN
jgi:hypothetical protein